MKNKNMSELENQSAAVQADAISSASKRFMPCMPVSRRP